MGHSWTEFDINYYYPAKLSKVFEAWSTGAGLRSFFIETIEVKTSDGHTRSGDEPFQTGDAYAWRWRHDYGLSGKFTAVEENQRISFTFGPMLVTLTFLEVNGATLVRLHQTGMPDNENGHFTSHMNCRICWTFFMTNLKSVLLTGTDLRDQDPKRASSFEVGYVPAESLKKG